MAERGEEVTLQALVGDPNLGLRFVVPPQHSAVVIRGHHVTDLVRPARYLLPGELLLTNGLWLNQRSATDWIDDVKTAGVAGLAFGLTDDCPDLPDSVEHSCSDVGLPLILVPAHLSFSAVIEKIDAAHIRPDPARLQLTRLRRLQQQLAGRTAQNELLALVRQETKLRCWLIGPGGRIIAGPAGVSRQPVFRTAARAGRTGKMSGPLGEGFTGFPVDSRRGRSSLTLVVECRLADLSDDARLVIETVMPSFFIEYAERRARDGMRGALVRELLELVWNGEIGRQAYAARLRAIQFDPAGPVTVLASGNDLSDLADAADGAAEQCAFAPFADVNVFLVQSDSPEVIDEIAALLDEGDVPPILGAGNAAKGPDGLRRSLATALSACRLAQSRPIGDQVVREANVGSYVSLLHSLDHRTLDAFKSALLSPLAAWDDEHEADLLLTVRTFIENDGRWRQTARALHIHHNTLKYRAQRIHSLTGRDLDSLQSRIDFALALAMTPAVETSHS
jgi:PucR family transcriptional regulator, purine catabolism regulatory protein